MALPAEKEYYTLADVLAWDEGERAEIIDGEVFLMGAPSSVHQEIMVELVFQLHAYLKGKKCRVYPAPYSVRLFEMDGDDPRDVDTVVEPDISVVCDRNKIDKNGCKGAPDMVIEILSPSTRRHDQMTKLNLYRRAGVREYWIVDPEAKVVLALLLEHGNYFVKQTGTAGDKMKVNVLEDCEIDLTDVFPEQTEQGTDAG